MNHIDALLRCVDEQSALLDDFIETLQSEGAQLLETPSDEALGALTARKNDFARRLGVLDQTRADCLNALGYADNAAAIDAACTAHPGLRPAFDALWTRADQAQALNTQNGQILGTFIGQNQRALDALHTLMGEGLYDARGRRASRP